MIKAIVFYGVQGDWQTFADFDSVIEAMSFIQIECLHQNWEVFEVRVGKFV